MSAIRFHNTSKRFIVEHDRPRSFQDLFVGWWNHREPPDELWALRDVSFEVEEGQTVALIGRNGTGKSTALKLAAGIIQPTGGRVLVRGQVGALLELGAGFHPDLTGRENVYLNGSLMGMSRRQMDVYLDRIVAFAELERFIDAPVKHYSSGMYLRLGFATAIHIQPGVLLIDEVLAVGDVAFQHKCQQHIRQMQAAGVTILLVSHDLNAVRDMCARAIWLDGGRIQADGPADDVVTRYELAAMAAEQVEGASQQPMATRVDGVGQPCDEPGARWGSGEVEITAVRFEDAAGYPQSVFVLGEPFVARMFYVAWRPVQRPVFGAAIYRSDGVHVSGPNTQLSGFDIDFVEGGGEVRYMVEQLNLLPGHYQFSAVCYDATCQQAYDHRHRAFSFSVRGGRERFGVVYLPSRWEHDSQARSYPSSAVRTRLSGA
jgi:ABC-type polysaccharide/polyol phosphate transport system ATPase subunit